MDITTQQDPRISHYIQALERLKNGDFNLDIPASEDDEIGQLGQALHELALSLYQDKNRLLGVAAHDLRGPLGVIQTATDLLMSHDATLSSEDRMELLASIGRQTRHMFSLLNNLMDLAEIEAGKFTLMLTPVDIAELLQDVVQGQMPMATSKNMRILLEVEEGEKIKADRLRIHQVVDNLISNAIKFSPHGSTIRVGAHWDAPVWRIAVQDEGPGITQQDRQRLFQAFARLSARPTGGEKSTGLGLAISRQIVEAHGGKIEVDSQEGYGATFWFTLPDQASKA